MELSPILQVLTILASGAGAAMFVENRISNKIDKITTKWDEQLGKMVPRPECALQVKEHERRIDMLERKIGDIAQKAQILVAERELSRVVGD